MTATIETMMDTQQNQSVSSKISLFETSFFLLEEIVWSRRAGIGARMMLDGACCLLGSP